MKAISHLICQQAEFKMKQSQFDKCVKRKKWAFDQERCMQLEEINSSDPNRLGPKSNKANLRDLKAVTGL